MLPRAAQTLELLLEVGRLLSSKLELEELLRTVLESASKVVNAESASLLLLDEKTEELYFDVALGLGEEASAFRLPMGQGIAGVVAKSRTPEIIKDVRSDPRWSSRMDEATGFVTRSILAVPMILQGRLLGVVEAINKRDGEFDAGDLRTFEAFASQSSVAIENARLFSSLRDEKLKLDTVFTEMTNGAVLTDDKGKVLLANEAARKFFGVGTRLDSLPAALKGMAVTPPLSELMGSEAPSQDFWVVRDEPKKLVLQGRATRIRGGRDEKPGFLCILRDVTDEMQKEGLKRTFLSLISHKLKTPLASVTGFSELLISEVKDQPVALKAAQTISAQGLKLANLVDKLLRYTMLEDPDAVMELKTCAVDEVIAAALKGLTAYLKERPAEVAYAPRGLSVTGDRQRLVEVFRNLIENAVKFDPKDERRVLVSCEPEGTGVLIHVADQGPGIPPEDQDRIYSQFHQVEASFTGQVDGWGLGLAYVKKVVGLHHGELRLLSKLGEGTTFTVMLPGAGS